VTILSTANASAKKKHKSPCRIRRNKKLDVLKRKIAERKALAAKPPESTGISSYTVAGPQVTVLDSAVPSIVSTCAGIKPSAHVADENMPPSELPTNHADHAPNVKESALTKLQNLSRSPRTISDNSSKSANKSELSSIHTSNVKESALTKMQNLTRTIQNSPKIANKLDNDYICALEKLQNVAKRAMTPKRTNSSKTQTSKNSPCSAIHQACNGPCLWM